MPRVLIADSLSPAAAQIFRDRGVEVDVKTGLSPEEQAAIIGQYDGVAVRSATKLKGDVLAAATNLKVVGRAGIGVDNIDVPGCTARGIVVMNTPFGNSITTAEHAIAMMFALAREIPAADASTQASKWEKSKFMGVEVTGKTLGIVGCGNIGSIVADRALGLRMKVIAFDPFLTEQRALELGVDKVDLDELLRRADFITLHTPLTDQTRNVISADAIAKMKKGARLINCARGGLVDEAALKEALDSGHLAGAALDVFLEEPARDNPLFGTPKLICTPHLGAATVEAQENVALQIAEQMSDFLLTGAVTNALNMPSLSAEDAARLGPYLKLADQMGSFSGQITESELKEVHISYSGAVARLNTKPLTSTIVKALLAPMLDSVNMVNAMTIAKERNIRVVESEVTADDVFTSSISLTVTTANRVRGVKGTLFGDRPRLIAIDGVNMDAEVHAHMLYVRNQDKPGFIGNLGRLLGDARVNIANFSLGRVESRDEAIALVSLDQKVDEPTRKRIEALPDVIQVKTLAF